MPDKKISELNTSGALTGNEEIPLVQSGTTFKTLLNTIKNFVTSTFNLQNVTDNGNTTTNKITVDAVNFSQTPTNSPAAGQVAYNGSTGALAYLMNNSNVMSNIGQTLHAYVNNADSVKITKGQPVYLFSASGNKASVKLAYNTSDATSAKTFGLAAEDIDVNQNGFIICQGVIDKLNTGSYTDGDTLYLGASAGTLTNIKPYAPNHLVYIGIVERANNGNGQIYVKVQNGYELDEIHDVYINPSTLANDDLLRYNSSTQLWNNSEEKTKVFKDLSISSALTGTTATTLIKSILIPANTIKVNDIVNIIVRSLRSTATGTVSQYLYYNTSASLTGATLMATQTAAMGFSSLQRNLFIRASNDSETIDSTFSVSTDVGLISTSTVVSNLNIDWTQNVYIIQAYKNAAVGDSTTSRGIVITRFR